MKVPPSPHFAPVDMRACCNARRGQLNGPLGKAPGDDDWLDGLVGLQALRGIPFLFAEGPGPNVLLLRPGSAPVTLPLTPTRASYILIAHAVEDRTPPLPPDLASVTYTPARAMGNLVGGDAVYTCAVEFADGQMVEVPILRRLAIQQRHVSWGASAFAAMPGRGPSVHASHAEDLALGRPSSGNYYISESRNLSGRVSQSENLWLYALPNPRPGQTITELRLQPGAESALVYAISTTTLTDHPLRLQERRKLRLTLPEGIDLNILGELDTDDRGDVIGIDLGTVISARAVLTYSTSDWLDDSPDAQPVRSEREVIVDYVAHPDAILHLKVGDGRLFSHDLRALEGAGTGHFTSILPIAPARRRVKFRILDKATGQRVAARLHLHGPHGEYLPPEGHTRKVNTGYFEDFYAEYANDLNQYAYVDGYCTALLPLGQVFVEISRGFEVRPLRQVVQVTVDTETLTFELEKVLHWRERGWVSADTHVHFLSPQTALLEGRAEALNIVNLLASQWGEMYSNVGDFDGHTTFGARDFGGDGEFLVRVGTENRMQVLGVILNLCGAEEAFGP